MSEDFTPYRKIKRYPDYGKYSTTKMIKFGMYLQPCLSFDEVHSLLIGWLIQDGAEKLRQNNETVDCDE